jgi:hypothetical protein
MKKPQRRFSSRQGQWLSMVREHNAILLRDGENPSDYPDKPVAFETPNFGFILSAPIQGSRRVLVKF